MKLGIHLGNNGASATADSLPTLATRAEDLGDESVWTSDHVVIPSSIAGEQPAGRPGVYDPADLQNYWEAFSVLGHPPPDSGYPLLFTVGCNQRPATTPGGLS